MLCHSVRSCFSPLRSVKRSSVAMVNLVTVVPLGVERTSGSFPRRPIRMTLLIISSPYLTLLFHASDVRARSRFDRSSAVGAIVNEIAVAPRRVESLVILSRADGEESQHAHREILRYA